MTGRLADRGIRAVLLDIEGTTTPIAFVHQILFPFARLHLAAYLRAHREDAEVLEAIARFSLEHADDRARGEQPPPWDTSTADATLASATGYARWLMERDRKSPGLKLLQGLIWEEGYQGGQLRGEVFDDVPGAIERWRQEGVRVAIYSSGSELAQRRLFESTPQGNLSALVDGFFDTRVGAKGSSESYRRIAAALGVPAGSVLFVSDVTAELTAATAAGMAVVLAIRPGNAPQPQAADIDAVRTFDEIR